MSLAMVDVRSPPAKTPASRNPNSRFGGQSFPFSPSLFDSMDPPKVSSTRKPRLVKLRRQGAGSVSGDGAGTPGRYGEVQDRLREWNPFVTDANVAASGSGASFVFGASGNAEFGFGARHYSSSSSTPAVPSVSVEKTLPDDLERKLNIGSDSARITKNGAFVFGAERQDETKESWEKLVHDEMGKLYIGNVAGQSADIGSNINLKGNVVDVGASSSSTTSVPSVNVENTLPDDLETKLKIGTASAPMTNNHVFIFGANRHDETKESLEKLIHDEMGKLNMGNLADCGLNTHLKGNIHDAGASSSSTASGLSVSVEKTLPDDMERKLKIGSRVSVDKTLPDDLETKLNIGSDGVPVSHNRVFVFGANRHDEKEESSDELIHDEMEKLKMGYLADRSLNTHLKGNIHDAGASSSSTASDPSVSVEKTLSDDMERKLKIGSRVSVDKTLPGDLETKLNIGSDGMPVSQSRAFVFGANRHDERKESLDELIHDEMGKLNMGNLANQSTDRGSNVNLNGTVFDEGEPKTSSSGNTGFVEASALEENLNLKSSGIGSLNFLRQVYGGGDDDDELQETACDATFVFGSAESNVLNEQSETRLSSDLCKLNLEKSSNSEGLDKAEDKDLNAKNDVNDAFVFDSSRNRACSASGELKKEMLNEVHLETERQYPAFAFTSVRDMSDMPYRGPHDHQTPKHDTSWSSKEKCFDGDCQNVNFSSMRGTTHKDTKFRNRRGKMKAKATVLQKESISREKNLQDNSEIGLTESFSPMDFSSYEETLTTEELSTKASMQSTESFDRTTFVDEVISMDSVSFSGSEFFVLESTISPEKEPLAHENVVSDLNNEVSASYMEKQTSNCGDLPHCTPGLEDSSEIGFKFLASSSQCATTSARRKYRRKIRIKGCHESTSHVTNHMVPPMEQFLPVSSSAKGGAVFSIPKKDASKESQVRQGSVSMAASSLASQQACEEWRLRGNQAYKNRNLAEAEENYSCGVNCVSPDETDTSCLRALMLCYSNRAVTKMSLGRIREALEDCMVAASMDQSFFKVQIRAANCYLALGEIDNAMKNFDNCLLSGGNLVLDRKLIVEASDGLKKAKHTAYCLNRSAELLRLRLPDDVSKALEFVEEGLSVSPYSEELIRMKAEALLMLRKYDEVTQLCEETLESARRNHGYSKNGDGVDSVEDAHVRFWRWKLIAMSYFYLGRLEEALDLLQKLEKVGHSEDKCGNNIPESSKSFAVTVRELLSHKVAGNEAFQAGRHLEAVQHYTAALACNVESRPFTAICFCNRAAAYQCLGQITDAIADCTLAIALDSNYPKAISRRATLHEMIRDYGHAVTDLQRLVYLLEEKAKDKSNQHAQLPNVANDLKQVRSRLFTMEQEARKDTPLNVYLILGIDPQGKAVEVKKAYRKAALRHHPDKAGQFLARNENGDDQRWKEVSDEVNRDAERLFKMIGEAYAVLSDPTKRLEYDAEEEMRNVQNKRGTIRTTDVHSSYERSPSRRQWKDVWKSYESPKNRWSESSYSSRYF